MKHPNVYEIIKSILYDNEYNEELQLRIVNAITIDENNITETEF